MAGAKKKVKCSDESVNSYGFRLLTAGCDLEQFEKNPVMLYGHDNYNHLPIGKWEGTASEGTDLYSNTDFDVEDPFAAEISRKVEKGYINMASVGITPIEFSDDPKLMVPGQTGPTITKWRLREISIVPFGANQNALVQLYDADGAKIEMNDMNILRLFEGHKPLIKNEFNMKEIAKILKLEENATEAEAVVAITALEKRATDAEKKLADKETAEAAAKKLEATALIDGAVADGRITASNKETYVKLFDLDFNTAKTALAAIQKPKSIASMLAGGNGNSDLGDRANWDFDKWQKEDSRGLELMAKSDPEAFQALYDAKYKKQ